MLRHTLREMGDWADEKASEMVEATAKNSSDGFSYSQWMFCDKCADLTEFDGDRCKKCGTKK